MARTGLFNENAVLSLQEREREDAKVLEGRPLILLLAIL